MTVGPWLDSPCRLDSRPGVRSRAYLCSLAQPCLVQADEGLLLKKKIVISDGDVGQNHCFKYDRKNTEVHFSHQFQSTRASHIFLINTY